MLTRRGLLGGLIAAPAVVAAGSLMPVRSIEWLFPVRWHHFAFYGVGGKIRIFVDGVEDLTGLAVHAEVTKRWGWMRAPDDGSLSYYAKGRLLDELVLRRNPVA